jgi:D-alanyl-D-alanine endopeptidase (penicillin-binding protein 7)
MKNNWKTFLAVILTATSLAGMALLPAEVNAASSTKKKVVTSKKAQTKSNLRTARKPKATVARKATSAKMRTAVAAAPAVAALTLNADGTPKLESSAVAIFDQASGDLIYEKNANAVVPIASITKLMTAMVALDAQPSLEEVLTVTDEDIDKLKGTSSRLRVGTRLSREKMLHLALMSSENRAASALSRHYPGGQSAFIAAMNAKAEELGLSDTRFADPTGLTPENVSSARDLVKLVDAAHRYPLIREFSTSEEYQVAVKGRAQTFRNTNALVRNEQWSIGLSKTGYISEAGKCLVMQAWLNDKPTIIVLLDSWGRLTRIGDANRVKRWIESVSSQGGAFNS